jgi:hypothetical protein
MSEPEFPWQQRRAALIVAHPGHELRVHHWLETRRPVYFCLTDGSGAADKSRMDSTSKLLRQTGATPGMIYGRFTDREVYQHLLDGRCEVFAKLLAELAESLIDHDISVVAGDAPEGVSPTHDLCRYLIDAAVSAVQLTTGRSMANYEFVLDSPPNDCPPDLRSEALWLQLDEAALDRKLHAALDYAELRGETEEGLKHYGKNAFALECLRPSTTVTALLKFEHEAPAYEHYGRDGVERFGKSFGRYEEVITFQKHVKPMIQAINKAASEFVPTSNRNEPANAR